MAARRMGTAKIAVIGACARATFVPFSCFWPYQKFSRFDGQRFRKFSDCLQASVKRSLFKLAKVAAADLRFIGEGVLR